MVALTTAIEGVLGLNEQAVNKGDFADVRRSAPAAGERRMRRTSRARRHAFVVS